MTHKPHTFLPRGLVIGGLLLAAGMAFAEDNVSNPAKRTEALAQSKALLATKDGGVAVKDPFHSEAFAETIAANSGKPNPGQTVSEGGTTRTPTGPRSPRDLLQAIATSIKPSGYFVIGGQPTLVFGQKRVKAGSLLTITFEGTEYTLEIVSIERPNFTLRLNREEFTRPIK